MTADKTPRPAKSIAIPSNVPPDGAITPPPTKHVAPRPAIHEPTTKPDAPVGVRSIGGHSALDAQIRPATGPKTSRPATEMPIPKTKAPDGAQTTHDHNPIDHQNEDVVGNKNSDGHTYRDTHSSAATGAGQDQAATGASIPNTPSLLDPALVMAADIVDDLEKVRIANENRLRQLTRDVEDSDGNLRGFGLDTSHPDVAKLSAMVAALVDLEHQATLNLARHMRHHPLGPWMKAQPGIGDKQGARLLAAIGDPYIRPQMVDADGEIIPARPRMVSELWAYTGYHVVILSHERIDTHNQCAEDNQTSGQAVDVTQNAVAGHGGDTGQRVRDTQNSSAGVAPKRARGQRANWSATARMRAFLIAESCMKQPAGTTYRAVYDAGREKYAEAVHKVGCVQCGSRGKPAQPGSPLSAGHQHARALRLVAKTVLRDLWCEAKRIHETASPAMDCPIPKSDTPETRTVPTMASSTPNTEPSGPSAPSQASVMDDAAPKAVPPRNGGRRTQPPATPIDGASGVPATQTSARKESIPTTSTPKNRQAAPTTLYATPTELPSALPATPMTSGQAFADTHERSARDERTAPIKSRPTTRSGALGPSAPPESSGQGSGDTHSVPAGDGRAAPTKPLPIPTLRASGPPVRM